MQNIHKKYQAENTILIYCKEYLLRFYDFLIDLQNYLSAFMTYVCYVTFFMMLKLKLNLRENINKRIPYTWGLKRHWE
jgi:hypothetical protein